MARDISLETGDSGRDSGIDFEEHLNEQQVEAVTHGGGPMLVLAGAGSGKTRTLTYRVAYLLELGVEPDRILLATFTNKAAREMLNRANRLTDGRAEPVWGGTFHHIGNTILRRHADLLGYDNQFTIIDSEDASTLIDEAVSELGLDEDVEPSLPKTRVLKTVFSLSQNTDQSIGDILEDRFRYHLDQLSRFENVFEAYQTRKQEQNMMDFDDLLVNLQVLLKTEREIRERYATQFRHVLVDEFQDTNSLQSEIVELLAEKHKNLMVVGDDAQSIYSFRGANFENILQFEERFPEAEVFKLEINYRSTPEILELANSCIQHNEKQYEKRLRAVRDSGYQPVLVIPENESEQAQFVAQQIQRLQREDDIDFDNQAVLYRAHHHSLNVQVELDRMGIPYYVRSGLRFFEQAHIKDITSFLKAALNPGDELAWKRIMKLYRGVGPATASKIYNALQRMETPVEGLDAGVIEDKLTARNEGSWKDFTSVMRSLHEKINDNADPSALIDLLLDQFYRSYLRDQYENAPSRLDDINQLAGFADRQADLEEFLDEMALRTNLGAEDVDPEAPDEEDSVVLSSVHQAKGLEWDVVYMIWLSDGEFPHERSMDDPEELEEERRLFYVASTRARDELYMSYPLFARKGKENPYQNPSQFVKELDESTYEKVELSKKSL